MPSLRVVAAGLAVACACAACGGPLEDLPEHRATWEDAGVADYRWTVRTESLGGFGSVTTQVRNGSPAKVWIEGRPVSLTSGSLPDAAPLTVEAFFDRMTEVAEIGDPDLLVVKFDPNLGYPTRLELDESVAMDDELSIVVERFTPTA